jgi:L-alanine-DL-glutamate epimerase-like enolase superfamily enzyme
MRNTDIRVRDVRHDYEDYRYRTPIKFGGVALDRVTILNVWMTVETRAGKTAEGFGSMPLGNVWAWPTRTLTYDQTLQAMKTAAAFVAMLYRLSDTAVEHTAHPIEITHYLEPHLLRQAERTREVWGLPEPMPALAVYVVASAFDAALHDAFGKAHGLNCYQTYGREFMNFGLGHFLGKEFEGETLDRYLLTEPKPRMPLYHLVGALDPLTDADVKQRLDDGLPNTLGEWIRADGLTHLKVKLNGDDLNWDVERVIRVNAVAEEVQRQRGVSRWFYSLDFNERCENVDYLLEFLRRLKELTPEGYDRVQYVEQPTARDLKANPANRMHDAARLKPVVIDESLVDLESLRLAREMGYTGVAFKACKGQTQTLLLAAAAQKYGMFRCVQDLSCPGASLIHSAGIAAHVPGVAAIEANSRQYCPAANAAWAPRFPGVFTTRDGTMNTAILNGPGLGAV